MFQETQRVAPSELGTREPFENLFPIHIIGIGNPYALELDEGFLKELARITEGSYNRINEGELYSLSHRIESLLEYVEAI